MPKKGKKIETPESSSPETESTDSRPYIDVLREKFLEHHDASLMLPEEERLSLEWKNITYKVPVVKKSGCKVTERTEKAILNAVSGYLPAGSLLGILGPSGSGKTTFLNVLSKKLRSKKITGELTINGEKASRRELQHLSGFVAQDDVLMGSLTAEEALLFAARLKLPNTVSEEQQIAIARSLLKNLGLEHVKDHMIGYTGALSRNTGIVRGLSGGERKRVSVCFEMVANPRILFLDEPTSGLDSFAAKAVMENLRDLAFYGRTVVCSIHSPSAQIFRALDYVLLLGEGQTVFFGPAHLAVQHFASLGIHPPPNVNPADFLLKAIHIPPPDHSGAPSAIEASHNNATDDESSSDANGIAMEDIEAKAAVTKSSGLRAATHAQVQMLIDGYRASSYAKDVNIRLGIETSTNNGKKKSKKHSRNSSAANASSDDSEEPKKKSKKQASSTTTSSEESDEPKKAAPLGVHVPKGYQASYLRQLRLLLGRSFTNLYREPALLKARLGQAIILGLLAGLIWLRLKYDQAGAADRYSSLFFVTVSAIFGAINSPTFVFPSERAVFFREKSSNMYSTGIYYFSKFLVELPTNLFLPIVNTTIIYWLIGYNNSPVPWLVMCGISILLNIVGHAVGMALTCVILDTGLVIKLQPLILLPCMLLSGLFASTSTIKARMWIGWLEPLSFMRYGYRASVNAVFTLGDTLNFTCAATDPACRFTNGAQIVNFLGFAGNPIYIDAIILAGFALGIHIIAFIALYVHAKTM